MPLNSVTRNSEHRHTPWATNMLLNQRHGPHWAQCVSLTIVMRDVIIEIVVEPTMNGTAPENFQSLTCKPDYMKHNFEVRRTLDP